MSSKLLKTFYLFLILFFISPQNTGASFSFNISSPSATLITSGSQEIDISVNIVDLPSESYFRVSLQKESGGTYYGYVQNNNNEWAKIQALSGDCLGYFKVSDLTTTLAGLKYKIGDDLFLDNGNYVLKAHRFTKTCTSYTEGLNTIPFIVNLPTSTPTQAPVTQQPTTAPTSAPTVKPTPTKSPTSKPTTSPTPTEESEETDEPTISMSDVKIVEATPTGLVAGAKTTNKKPVVALIFIYSGILFLGYGGYLLYNMKHKNEEIDGG